MIDLKHIPAFTLRGGEPIPAIGMGTFGSDRVSALEVAQAVAGGVRAGYRLLDCAACYGNEAQIGESIHAVLNEGVVRREELFVMTKVWNDMHRDVAGALNKSLHELRLDYVDMLFIHWPFPNYHAPGCSVEARNPNSQPFSITEFLDTYSQLEALRDAGLIRYIGVSNMTIPKLDAVLPKLKTLPAACEIELHPYFQQCAIVDALKTYGILPIGYMPLGSPRRPERDILDEDLADMEAPELIEIAHAHNCTTAAICLKWAIQRGTLPIPFSIHHYRDNLAAVASEPLTDAEMRAIADLECGNRLVKGQVFLWPGANDWHDLWDEDGVIPDCREL